MGVGRASLCLGLGLWAGCQSYELDPVKPNLVAERTISTVVTGRPLPPNLMLVVDKSGSMSDFTDGSGHQCLPPAPGQAIDRQLACKWNDLRKALDDPGGFILSNKDKVRFGLVTFADDSGCSPGTVKVPIGGDPTAIISYIEQVIPAGGTPTTQTLARLAAEPAFAETDRSHYVVLLTDGLPNCDDAFPGSCCTAACCSASCCVDPSSCCTLGSCAGAYNKQGCLDGENLIATVGQLAAHNPPVRTIVIGLGADTRSGFAGYILDRAADAGGMAQVGAATKYYQANTLAELQAVLRKLTDFDPPCRYILSPTPKDPSLVDAVLIQGGVERRLARPGEWDFGQVQGALNPSVAVLKEPLCSSLGNATPSHPITVELRFITEP